MTQTSRCNREKLQKRCALIALACGLIAIALPVLFCLDWISSGLGKHVFHQTGIVIKHQPSFISSALAFISISLPFLLLSYGLIQARRAFKSFANADWYSEIIPKSLATGGFWVFVAGIFLVVQPTLLGLFATMDAPAGEKVLTIVASSNSMICIIAGAIIWAFGMAWQDARNLADENAGFI